MIDRTCALRVLSLAAIMSSGVMAQHPSSLYDLKTETLQGTPADLGAYRGRLGEEIMAKHARPPAIGANQGRQQPHHRGLPGPVRPEKRVDRTLPHRQINTI